MSLAIAHFCFGAGCSLILFAIYCRIKDIDHRDFDILVLLAGGIWAMLPDLPIALGLNPYINPTCPPAWMNIFFLHSFFDCTLDVTDSYAMGVIGVGFLTVVIGWMYKKEIEEFLDWLFSGF